MVATEACPSVACTRWIGACPCSSAWVAWAWRSQWGDAPPLPVGSPTRAAAARTRRQAWGYPLAVARHLPGVLARLEVAPAQDAGLADPEAAGRRTPPGPSRGRTGTATAGRPAWRSTSPGGRPSGSRRGAAGTRSRPRVRRGETKEPRTNLAVRPRLPVRPADLAITECTSSVARGRARCRSPPWARLPRQVASSDTVGEKNR